MGCGGAVKQSWTNFRAHYNTYYNAEKSFRAGQQKILSQSLTIDPEEPVRVHRALPQAGAEEFENTIEKGAQIIRKFSDSKWTDDALFLMGKSYYYRKEYYLGLQKFEELYEVTDDPRLKQESVIWKGRTLLDLKQNGEGISFLEEELSVLEENWESGLKAELRVLIAEHHAVLENWQEAHDLLETSVTELPSRSLKMKAYFLYAQVHEKLENYNEAYLVYDRVTSIYTDYQYSFWAELFKGKIARMEGNLDQSLYIFNSMSKDDKNFDRMDEINYQIAKTEQVLGQLESSERRYKQLLRSTINQPSLEVQSKTYYELGKIYSEYYNAYETAAAYFDSSSAVSVSAQNLQSEGAGSLASAYGDYASLKSEEQRIDSLLALGELNEQELESALQEIRQNRFNQITEGTQSNQNVLTNISQENIQNEGDANQRSDFGFLNYKNVQLASASASDFRAVWGNRPLVDDWRRAEAIQGNRNNRQVTETNEQDTDPANIGYSDEDLGINIGAIPRTDQEKRQSYRQKVNVQYQLGNLFFLTLNMPDSASIYFNKVIESGYAEEDLMARTRYALYQVYRSNGEPGREGELAQQIIDKHAGTIYADRVKEQINQEDVLDSERDSVQQLLQEFKNIEQSADSMMIKAKKYRILAQANTSNELAPHIHFRALQEYLNRAKDSTNSEIYNRYWSADSTIARQDQNNINPFKGAEWDTVRILVNEHISKFKSQPYKEKVNKIDQILKANAPDSSLPSCSDLGVSAEVKPDMDTFLSSIILPQELKNQRLSGSITYSITISRTGNMEDFELESPGTLESLENAYNAAIEESLDFYPFEFESEIESVRCSISFPVKN